MAKEIAIRLGERTVRVKETLLDRALGYVAPERALNRLRARFALEMASGGYGTHRKRRNLSEWAPPRGDADADILSDLQDLRDESRDLERTVPLATGAIRTKVTNIVGSGLRLNATIDLDVLGLSEDQAEELELGFEREWRLFADSVECDIARTQNFASLTRMVLHSRLVSGDVPVLLPFLERPGCPYGLKIQVLEADRVSNPQWSADTPERAGGVERHQQTGEPIAFWVASKHPGSRSARGIEWKRIPAFTPSGRPNMLLIYDKRRPGQVRGVPDLAPVIEPLKQLGRYSQAEIDAAVVSSFLTVFVKSDQPDGALAPMQPTAQIGGAASDKDFKLGPAAVLGLEPNESIETVTPGRPNTAFDPFVMAVLRQIGVALELPFEILIKHFTASYSAARAAIVEAWKYFMVERAILRDQFCQPIYEALIFEAVARGRVAAPGFLSGDPIIRKAYLGARWIGPGRGQIDEKKEVEAAALRVQHHFSTKADETAAISGGDYEANLRQRRREIVAEQGLPATAAWSASPDDDENADRPETGDSDLETLRERADAYGIGVRAGLITPQQEDEEFFRARARLPSMSPAAVANWRKHHGIRDPITLREAISDSSPRAASSDGNEDEA